MQKQNLQRSRLRVSAMRKRKAKRVCVCVCFYKHILLIGRRRGWCISSNAHFVTPSTSPRCAVPVRHFFLPTIIRVCVCAARSFTKASRCNLQKVSLLPLRHVFLATHFYEIILTKME